VEKSTLRITDVTGNDKSPNWSLDIQVKQAIEDGLITLDWNGTDSPANTEATLTLTSHTLATGNTYKLQMVDNQASGANDLPLILGGTIDLLSGFEFQVNHAPTITQVFNKRIKSKEMKTFFS